MTQAQETRQQEMAYRESVACLVNLATSTLPTKRRGEVDLLRAAAWLEQSAALSLGGPSACPAVMYTDAIATLKEQAEAARKRGR